MGILQISIGTILLPLSHQCRSKPLPLPGRSWLATIAGLMGLVCLFSFPLAGSIDPCLQPFPLPQPTPLPDPIAHIPRTHSSGPPWLCSFHALHSAGHKSLFHSFFCHPSLCTLSRSAWCTLSHLQNLWCQFLSLGTLFVSPPSAPPFISVIFFFLSCSVCSSSSHLSLPFPLLSCTTSPPPPHPTPYLFTLPLSFHIPQSALLVQCAIHCQHIFHGWGVAPHSNII